MAEVSPGAKDGEALAKMSPTRRLGVKILDQGQGDTCVIHALANAVSQCLMDDCDIRVIPEECLGALKQLEVVEIFGGNHVHDFHGATLKNMTDLETGGYGKVKVSVTKVRKGERKGGQFVLVYDRIEGDPETKHCVYIQGVCSDKRTLSCINSWGPGQDETLSIPVQKTGNTFYRIDAKWIPLSLSQTSHNIGRQLLPTLNTMEIIFLISVPACTITFFGKVVPLNFGVRKTVGV